MPTYSWRCPACGEVVETTIPLSEYLARPPAFFHCGIPMERWFPPTGRPIEPVSDRHYAGLVAPDGTDISTRAKHRQYMRDHNLTTADDFKETWAQAQATRDRYRTGQGGGAVTRDDIARVWAREDGQSDI